jgi:phosphocarrier protein HPr
LPTFRVVVSPWPPPIEPQMSHDTTVARRQVEITNFLGLHMRPADKFVRLALRYQSEVKVHYNGRQFNGKSILDLTTLCAERGTRLELEARGPDAAEAIEALAGLVFAHFYANQTGEALPSQPSQGKASTEPAR